MVLVILRYSLQIELPKLIFGLLPWVYSNKEVIFYQKPGEENRQLFALERDAILNQ